MKRGLQVQAEDRAKEEPSKDKSDHSFELEPRWETPITTGSTLLDLAIGGLKVHGGGMPTGVVIEVYGVNSTGKTAILSEAAGAIEAVGGDYQFVDPEDRLDLEHASLYGADLQSTVGHKRYINDVSTVTDLFSRIGAWQPKDIKKPNAVFADSLAALSTELEMENEDGDKMGMRRAKEFSEGFRKWGRSFKARNMAVICSNQVRETTDQYGHKLYKPSGGQAIGHWSSIRLELRKGMPFELTRDITVGKLKLKRTYGIKTDVKVIKNSVDCPYRSASFYLIFNYGIDDIRANLLWLRDATADNVFWNGIDGKQIEKACIKIEEKGEEKKLREEVIDLWLEIDKKHTVVRQPKRR